MPAPTLRWDFIERGRAAGVQPFRVHDLRHSYVSLQRQAETRMEVISANLGHANSNITRVFYLDVFAEDRQESATMDAILPRVRAERTLS